MIAFVFGVFIGAVLMAVLVASRDGE